MPHYRSMFESNGMLYACHLQGKDVTLTIKHVEAGTITGAKGKKDKKPLITFVERPELKLGLNKTNGKIIASLYGPDTDEWRGKRITLYPTSTEFGSEQVECIRIRPRVPAERPQRGAAPPADPPAPATEEPNRGA